MTFDKYLAKQLEDDEFRKEYELLQTVDKYKRRVVISASKRFSITISEAELIMQKSGINDLIDSNPSMIVHFAPEEWNENIESYLRAQEKSGV